MKFQGNLITGIHSYEAITIATNIIIISNNSVTDKALEGND